MNETEGKNPKPDGGMGETEAALERVLAVARRRARSLGGAFVNFTLSRRYDLTPLDGARLVEEAPRDRVPDCAQCADRCCARPHNLVVLRLSDVARLVDAGLGWAVMRQGSRFSDAARAAHPEVEAFERLDTVGGFPWLARRADGACVFLDEQGRCAAYTHRPLACRRFPFRVDDSGTSVALSSACGCLRPSVDDTEALSHVEAAVSLYGEKLRDLLTLAHAREALRKEGLAKYLPVLDE